MAHWRRRLGGSNPRLGTRSFCQVATPAHGVLRLPFSPTGLRSTAPLGHKRPETPSLGAARADLLQQRWWGAASRLFATNAPAAVRRDATSRRPEGATAAATGPGVPSRTKCCRPRHACSEPEIAGGHLWSPPYPRSRQSCRGPGRRHGVFGVSSAQVPKERDERTRAASAVPASGGKDAANRPRRETRSARMGGIVPG